MLPADIGICARCQNPGGEHNTKSHTIRGLGILLHKAGPYAVSSPGSSTALEACREFQYTPLPVIIS